MSNGHSSDDQILEKEKRSYRDLIAMLASFFILVTTEVLLKLANHADLIPTWLANILATTLLLSWLLVVFVYFKPGIPSPADVFDEEYLRKTIDVQHRRWRFPTLFVLIGLCELAWILTWPVFDHPGQVPFLGYFALAFTFVAVLALLTVAYGPGFFLPFYRRALNDELMRAQRAKVAQFGYIFAVIEMCAALLISAYKPQWGLRAAPIYIATAIVLPGLYFMFLQWRADRDG